MVTRAHVILQLRYSGVVEEPKPTYKAIFGAYWRRIAGFVELWWVGFGLVQLCLFTAVVVARNPGLVPGGTQQPAVSVTVVLAVVAFAVTIYYEFL